LDLHINCTTHIIETSYFNKNIKYINIYIFIYINHNSTVMSSVFPVSVISGVGVLNYDHSEYDLSKYLWTIKTSRVNGPYYNTCFLN